jgi:hypothetical protein
MPQLEATSAKPKWNDRMKKLPRIAAAQPVIYGVLKLVFTDGYERVVDLRPSFTS